MRLFFFDFNFILYLAMASFTAIDGNDHVCPPGIVCLESMPGKPITIQDILAGKSVHLGNPIVGPTPFCLDGIEFRTLSEMITFIGNIRKLSEFQTMPPKFNGYVVNGQFYINDIEFIFNLHEMLDYYSYQNEFLISLSAALWDVYCRYYQTIRAYPNADMPNGTHCIKCNSPCDDDDIGSQVTYTTHYIIFCKSCVGDSAHVL